MSGVGNPYVSMDTGVDSSGTGDYSLQMAKLQRQQRLADALQQQAYEPIQLDNRGPISWTQGIEKLVQAWAAKKQSDKYYQQLGNINQADRAQSQALVRALTGQAAPASSAPGTSAADPMSETDPEGNPMGVPTGMSPMATPMSPQQQIGALLTPGGGPQTQAVRSAMLPVVMAEQKRLQERQLLQQQLKGSAPPPGVSPTAWSNMIQFQPESAQKVMEQSLIENAKPQLTDIQKNAAALGLNPGTPEYQDFISKNTPASLAHYNQGQANYRANLLHGMGDYDPSDPVTQAYTKSVLSGNATMQQVPMRYRNAVAMSLAGAGPEAYSPLAQSRTTSAAQKITTPYTNLAQYKLAADASPYLQRIDAAMQHPGSVSDQELLDSITKLNTGGNAVTDAQVKVITDGKSLSDWMGTLANKVQNGGVLSDNQRKQIFEISKDVFANYRKGYQPVYEQVSGKLKAAGIPEAFWTIPDLDKLNANNPAWTGGSEARTSAAPGGKKIIKFSDMK